MLYFITSSVQSLSHVRLFVTPWIAACQASLSITNSQSLLKVMSIESVTPCNHLILRRPLLLLPSIFPSFTVFSSESALHIRWPKYWIFSSIMYCAVLCLVTQLCLMDCSLPSSSVHGDSPGKNTGVGYHVLL